MNYLTLVAKVLLVVGGVNWGLVAINRDWDLVNLLLDSVQPLETLVYALVGLSALWLAYKWTLGCGSCQK